MFGLVFAPSFLRRATAVASIAVGVLGGCNRAPEAPTNATAPAALPVRVAAVEFSGASPLIRAVGVLARQTEADLSFPVAGIVERVNVRAGDAVRAGQELARLQLDPIEAQAMQAGAMLEKARRDLARVEKLQAERVATLENLQDAKTQVEHAAALVRIAEFNRKHSTIVAPADGVVLRRLAEPNELVAAGRPVLAFAAESEGWIAKTGVAARDAARFSRGATVEIVDAAAGRVKGTVVRLGEAADAITRTIPIEVRLEQPLPGGRSGMVVTLWIQPEPVPPRPAVPIAALREGTGGSATVFVLAADGKTVKRAVVEIEQVDGDRAYLRGALPADARVVIAGGQFLRDGEAVTVTP